MTTSRSVLIIDDDADFRTAVGGLLVSSGYDVLTATSGREGLDVAKRASPDLILLDVMMDERTDGFFTLQQIRRVPSLRNTPVIVVSSIYTDQPTFRVDPQAGWLPASLFLPKPVDPVRLLAESARLIEDAAVERGAQPVGEGRP